MTTLRSRLIAGMADAIKGSPRNVWLNGGGDIPWECCRYIGINRYVVLSTHETEVEALEAQADHINQFRAAAALDVLAAVLEAEGLRVVPVVATDEMKAASGRIPHARDAEIFAAMLSAAPDQLAPVVEDTP